MKYNRNIYLKDFLIKLFDLFNTKAIEFLILRNYESLPDELRDGGDIDFILSSSSYGRIYGVLSDMDGLDILISSRRTVVHEFVVMYEGILYVKLDFHPFEDWHGAIYFESSEIFSSATKYKMFPVPSAFHQAITMLFASYLYGGFIKQKYMDFVKPTLANSKELDNLVPIFGEKNIDAIRDFAKQDISEKKLLSRRKSILYNLVKFNIKKYGLQYIKRFVKTRIEEVLLRVKYNGVIIRLETQDNKAAIITLTTFLQVFLGSDRICILNQNSGIRDFVKVWDYVGRLKIIIYDNCSSIFMKSPDVIMFNHNTICEDVVEYLINRNIHNR